MGFTLKKYIAINPARVLGYFLGGDTSKIPQPLQKIKKSTFFNGLRTLGFYRVFTLSISNLTVTGITRKHAQIII